MPVVSARHAPVTIRAAGGPTVVMDIGGLRLVTDPTFDPPGDYLSGSGSVLTKTAAPALGPDEIGSAARAGPWGPSRTPISALPAGRRCGSPACRPSTDPAAPGT